MTPNWPGDQELIRLICSEKKAEREKAATYLANCFSDDVQTMVTKWNQGYPIEAGIVLDDSVMALMYAVRIGNYRLSSGALKKYFLGIVRNRIKSAVRRERNRKNQNRNYAFLWERAMSKSKSSDDPLLSQEFKHLIAEALKALDPPCRDLLKRYWFKGERLKDIAEDLGVSESTAKKRHERCRKKLKDILGKDPRQL